MRSYWLHLIVHRLHSIVDRLLQDPVLVAFDRTQTATGSRTGCVRSYTDCGGRSYC